MLSLRLTWIMLLGLTVPAMAAEDTGFPDVAPAACKMPAINFDCRHFLCSGTAI